MEVLRIKLQICRLKTDVNFRFYGLVPLGLISSDNFLGSIVFEYRTDCTQSFD